MTAPPPGVPDKEVGGPDVAIRTAAPADSHLTAMKRRRAASQRLAILNCGRSDLWHYEPLPLTEHQRDAWARTVEHLRRSGFEPIVPAAVMAVIR